MFLEIIAKTLGYDLEEFGKKALKAQGNIQINSMCTVFAQSEVTSLLAKRQKREDIARGIHMAILSRTLSLLKRVSTISDIVFAGGVAKNPCLKYLLGDALGCEVKVPEDPQMVGALGAILMRAFLKVLLDLRPIPTKLIFINSGVHLTSEGSEVLDTIKALSGKGVEVLSCGTCLDFYGLKEKLRTGIVSNMYDIAQSLLEADRLIRP
jgi:hypothetical protein